MELSHEQILSDTIERIPLYFDASRNLLNQRISPNAMFVFWSFFLISLLLWFSDRIRTHRIWGVKDKGKKPREIVCDSHTRWLNGEIFQLWRGSGLCTLNKIELREAFALLKDRVEKDESVWSYNYYFVQYLGYISNKKNMFT